MGAGLRVADDGGRPPPSYDAPVELAWLDRHGVITDVNEAWRVFCTANDGDHDACGPGASYLEVCDADPDASALAAMLRAQLAGERLVPAVFTIPCDGPSSTRWFDVHLSPRVDVSGAVDGVTVALVPVGAPMSEVTAAVPVTDLIESAPDGALLVDPGGIIHYANAPLCALSGYQREVLVGQPVEVLLAQGVRKRHQAWRHGYQATPRARPMGTSTLTLLRADGAGVPVEISLAPVDVGGVRMTFASVRDVSEVRAQDRARRRLLYLLDLDPDAVYVVDADTTAIEYANSGACALLGYTQAELLQLTLWDLTSGATEEARGAVLAEHAREGPGHVHMIDVVRRTKDGDLVPCDTRGQLVSDTDGHRTFTIVDRDARPRLAYERERGRQLALSRLVAEVTQLELSIAPEREIHQHLVDGAARLLDAENASLVVYDPRHDRIDTLAAVGTAAEARLRDGGSLAMDVLLPWMHATSPVLLPGGPPYVAPDPAMRKGPGVVAQFRAADSRLGLLTAFRAVGGEPFTTAEGRLLADLAGRLALVVELGRARVAGQRLELVEERQRIARDLHDMVIQDLIGIGMQLADGSMAETEAGRDALVEQLDDTIRRLRLVVFDARSTQLQGPVGDEIRRTVREAARTLDHRPELTMDDGVDALPADLVAHLLSVLREGLSNVARHARASQTAVRVTLSDDTVTVVVEDDGQGLGTALVHGTGTASMRERAEMVSGTLSLTDRVSGGAQLEWTARIPR